MQNKPNSPIVQIDLNLYITKRYARLRSLTKVKNKAKQTQFKPNLSQLKPKQTQFKPNPLTMEKTEL
jgi:hypothetical protein